MYLIDEGGPEFAAKKECVNDRLFFAPPKYTFIGKPGDEGNVEDYSITYWPANDEAGPLRILVDRGNAFFQTGPTKNDEYRTFFHSAIRKDEKERGFCLMAAGAPSGTDHWVRFDNFRVVK